VLHHSYHTVYMRLLMHKSTRVLCMIAYVSTHIHIYIHYPDIPRGQHYLSWQSIQDNSSVQGKQQQHGTCVCVCVCVCCSLWCARESRIYLFLSLNTHTDANAFLITQHYATLYFTSPSLYCTGSRRIPPPRHPDRHAHAPSTRTHQHRPGPVECALLGAG
jgi:hypothetical protein